MHVGGNDDSSTFKPLDGTNYKQWAPKMRAYLMSKELWGYISGQIPCPKSSTVPKEPTPDTITGMITTEQKEAYDAELIAFNAANEKFVQWNIADDKALRAIQLRMIDRFNYLVQDSSAGTWNNIKRQFDVSGPAAIFVDFRYVINFKFDEKKDPSVQVAELNTKLDVLSTHGFMLDERIQAMIILSGLPQSWDSVQGAILANMPMNKLKIDAIMPILQEEWQRCQARRHEHKLSHLARMNIRGGPQRQQWQGPSNYNQQAGQQNYNNNYNKPAPYNKFGKKPNRFNNSNSNQKPDYNKPSGGHGPNWARNKENRENKKKAKMLLTDQVKKLESNQEKPDKKGKGKAPKTANLLARIDEEIPLIDRIMRTSITIMKEFLSLLKVIKLIKLYRWTLTKMPFH